jgi:hypothetical protein
MAAYEDAVSRSEKSAGDSAKLAKLQSALTELHAVRQSWA